MHLASAHADHATPCADAGPFFASGVELQFTPGRDSIPASIRRWMVERDDLATRAGLDVQTALAQLADLLGSALMDWIGTGEGGSVRGRVLAMSLTDALDILDGVTGEGEGAPVMQVAREAWAAKLHDLADMALRNTLDSAGLRVDGLDADGWAAVQRGALENAASAWDTNIRRNLGDATLRAASEALYATPDVVRQVIRDMVTDLTPAMVTEARTATAAYDRIVSAAVADDIDPDGELMRWCYSGPVDGLQRPFCVAATGKSFTRMQVAILRNGTPGMPVTDFCGGYNCRHQWLHMLPGQATRAGFDAATAVDVLAINALALGKRR